MTKERHPYFQLLSPEDRATYDRIASAIAAPTNRDRRNKRAEDFREIIEALVLFENHEETEKWKRSLVCGLFPFEGGIAVNVSALKKLLFKCKSSINAAFKSIGYTTVSAKAGNCEELLEGIPFLRDNINDLRKWTVRYRTDSEETKCDMDISPPSASINARCENGFVLSASNMFENETSDNFGWYARQDKLMFQDDLFDL